MRKDSNIRIAYSCFHNYIIQMFSMQVIRKLGFSTRLKNIISFMLFDIIINYEIKYDILTTDCNNERALIYALVIATNNPISSQVMQQSIVETLFILYMVSKNFMVIFCH